MQLYPLKILLILIAGCVALTWYQQLNNSQILTYLGIYSSIPGHKRFSGSFEQAKMVYIIEPRNGCSSDLGEMRQTKRTVFRVPPVTVFVVSLPEEFIQREIIRLTWSSVATTKPEISVVFVLGLSQNEREQKRVEIEADKFGDILQAKMIEKYENLAWKTFYLLNWAAMHCPSRGFIMKADSDTIVFKRGVDIFRKTFRFARKPTIWGNKRRSGPIRDPESRWYISFEEYSGNTFPTHCSGTGYIMNGKVPKLLVAAAKKRPTYFHLEDVMFTGIAASAAKVARAYHPGFAIGGEINFCEPRYMTQHMWNAEPDEMLNYWEEYQAGIGECDDKVDESTTVENIDSTATVLNKNIQNY